MKTQTKSNFMIYGREKGKRGGAFAGINKDNGKPMFGGQNLIHSPIFWNTDFEEVEKVCKRIMDENPEFECYPKDLRKD